MHNFDESLGSEIEHFVASLPENGEWWRDSGRVTYILAAKRLCNLGVGLETIREVLESLYQAAAAEFGN